MFHVALILSAALSGSSLAGRADRCPSVENLGAFGCMGATTTPTDVPQAPISRLVNPGLAQTADGYWLRWRFQWDGSKILGLEGFERVSKNGDLRGWNVPTATRSVDAPETLVGERGCRLMGAVIAAGRRLGAWNCESSLGTVLAVPTRGGGYKVIARLSRYYQAISATPVEHGAGSRVTLVRYDPGKQNFELLDLAWR